MITFMGVTLTEYTVRCLFQYLSSVAPFASKTKSAKFSISFYIESFKWASLLFSAIITAAFIPLLRCFFTDDVIVCRFVTAVDCLASGTSLLLDDAAVCFWWIGVRPFSAAEVGRGEDVMKARGRRHFFEDAGASSPAPMFSSPSAMRFLFGVLGGLDDGGGPPGASSRSNSLLPSDGTGWNSGSSGMSSKLTFFSADPNGSRSPCGGCVSSGWNTAVLELRIVSRTRFLRTSFFPVQGTPSFLQALFREFTFLASISSM